jgi:hypothetical protein
MVLSAEFSSTIPLVGRRGQLSICETLGILSKGTTSSRRGQDNLKLGPWVLWLGGNVELRISNDEWGAGFVGLDRRVTVHNCVALEDSWVLFVGCCAGTMLSCLAATTFILSAIPGSQFLPAKVICFAWPTRGKR